MPTLTVTDSNFKTDVLQSDVPVLVDFWAEWCGPCKAMAPALEELSGEMGGQAIIAKMNIEDSPNTPLNFHVRGVPTLMIFKNGQVAATKNGSMTKSKMAEWIAEFT
ncbi:MAG: thioredoxin [Robiginitomaculum sp.]